MRRWTQCWKAVSIQDILMAVSYTHLVNVKTGCNLITDSTDYLVVRYRAGRGYHDTTEQLIAVSYTHLDVYKRQT